MNLKFQYWFFIIFTFIYFLAINKFFGVTLNEVQGLEPNALGDFLAGTFSPLAFLFLILGYLQTNKSLSQNTEAISQQAVALEQQAIALQQQAKSLETQIEELQISNHAFNKQVEEMEKSVKTQQEMFELAEKQYLESHEEKIKNSTPQIQLIGSKYKCVDPYHSSNFQHQFNLTIKVENLSIKNLNLRMSDWYITKSGGSMNNSMTLDINSIDANRSEVLIIYKQTNHAPFNNDHLYLSYYDEYGVKYQKTYEFTNTEDNIVVLKEKI